MKKLLCITLLTFFSSCCLFGTVCKFKRIVFSENGIPERIDCVFYVPKSSAEKPFPSPVIITQTHIVHLGDGTQPRNTSKDPEVLEIEATIDLSSMADELGDVKNQEWRIKVESGKLNPCGKFVSVIEVGGKLIGFALGVIDDDPAVIKYLKSNNFNSDRNK